MAKDAVVGNYLTSLLVFLVLGKPSEHIPIRGRDFQTIGMENISHSIPQNEHNSPTL
jgi:hypothetical protein